MLAMVALLGAACGSGNDGNTSTPAADDQTPVSLPGKVNAHGTEDLSSAGGSTDVEIEMDDFYFAPTFVKAAPGQVVKVTLKNEGEVNHTFTSAAAGVDEEVAPGTEKTVTVTVPASGNVEWRCRFHGDDGMQGAFFTAAAGAVPQETTTTDASPSNY